MLRSRKRERGPGDAAESVGLSAAAVKQRPGVTAASSCLPSGTEGPMQPRVVNMTSHSDSTKELTTSRPPVTTPRTPYGATAAPKMQRLHVNTKATRAVEAPALNGGVAASTRSSDSGASASSVPSRKPPSRIRPPLSRLATSGAPRNATPLLHRGRGAVGALSHDRHAVTDVGSPLMVRVNVAGAASFSHTHPDKSDIQLWSTWQEKRKRLEREVQELLRYSDQLTVETRAVEDSIEGMLTGYEEEKQRVEAHHTATVAHYEGVMSALQKREEGCSEAKRRALERICTSQETVCQLHQAQEETRGSIILAEAQRDELVQQLATANSAVMERASVLQQLQQEEDRMKDATYGLSGEVKELVLEMERLRKEKHCIEVQAMQTEMTRRELYSLCEELKGSIRVYCRVKGSALPADPQHPDEVTMRNESPMPQVVDAPKSSEISASVVPSADAFPTASSATVPLYRPPSRSDSPESSLSANLRAVVGSSSGATKSAFLATDPRRNAAGGGGLRSGRSTARSSIATASVAEDSEVDVTVDDGAAPVFSFPDRGGAETIRDANRHVEPGSLSRMRGVMPTTSTDDPMTGSAPAVTPLLCTSTVSHAAGTEGEELQPAADAALLDGLPCGGGRSITIHQTRSNATSTGLSSFTETFTYDRVFTGDARQAEVYQDVEPLVRNAVDGYRVCIFAYGQTGSGKTFTMEGDVRDSPEMHGVTPRALQTILRRQAELSKEGWCYELSCTFVEIYNDVIRDLFQSGSVRYEATLQQHQQQTSMSTSSSAAAYHIIKHIGDRTIITHVVEKKIESMEDFLQLYKHAVLQRSTTKTDLNDASSRSHCIFTLNIVGTNATISKRSDGALCLVDLAGSERVNESGVQGKHFKEAVNINRSLLDLGKCIRALRCGSVVPWRNCKLTYLLQNYLGAKGGKMLMIVTVSSAKTHVPESLNSLRFAARVQETYVGTSVKRLTSI